ncbi:melanocyte-stimulating hormone receptor-like [Oculina patagonica]
MEADYHDAQDEPFCTARLLIGSHALWFCIIAFHIFLGITSMLSNTVILVALHKESSLHPPSKILLRSLALTDFCVGMLLEPLFVIFLMTVVNKSLNLCREIVVFTLFAGQVLCCVSLFTLTAISVDRLLALLLGMRYRQVVTFKRVLFSVIWFWILSIGFATVVFWNKKITACYVAIVVLLCIIVSTYCYIKIYLKLLHHQAQIQEHVHQGQPNGHEPLNIARYRKTVSSALWIQVSVLACYLPMVLTSVSIAVEGLTSSVFFAWTLSSTLVFFNSTLNPVLYCWKIREVRSSTMNTLRQIWCCL